MLNFVKFDDEDDVRTLQGRLSKKVLLGRGSLLKLLHATLLEK